MSQRLKASTASIEYCRFLNLAAAAQEKFVPLDWVESDLLNRITVAWSLGAPLTVMELMEAVPGASSATVHRRLSLLAQKNLISNKSALHDGRVKLVYPTQVTLNHFGTLGKRLHSALGI